MDRRRQAGRDERQRAKRRQVPNFATFRTAPRSKRREVPNGAAFRTARKAERARSPQERQVPDGAGQLRRNDPPPKRITTIAAPDRAVRSPPFTPRALAACAVRHFAPYGT